CTGRFDYW
nr:immunoglobulin heavy chain junction region [Mus musculus]